MTQSTISPSSTTNALNTTNAIDNTTTTLDSTNSIDNTTTKCAADNIEQTHFQYIILHLTRRAHYNLVGYKNTYFFDVDSLPLIFAYKFGLAMTNTQEEELGSTHNKKRRIEKDYLH